MSEIDEVRAWYAARPSRILRDDEEQARADIVRVAKTWLGTPYVHRQKLKHCGADCLTFVVGVFEEAGLIEPIPLKMMPFYTPQRHLTEASTIAEWAVLLYLTEAAKWPERAARPGDVLMAPAGKELVHCGLVIEWPSCMHCYRIGGGVQFADFQYAPNKIQREVRIFSPWSG